jgi:GNAT superfamily N-acetyltransferase
VRLRPAVPDDAPALLANVVAGFEGYRAFAPPGWIPPQEDTPARLAELREMLVNPGAFARVAEVDGVFAGHVLVEPGARASPDGVMPDLHVRHLFVPEPFWGTGVARELHGAAVDWMHGLVRLFTPTGQARARRFYEREGWTLHGQPWFVMAMQLSLVEYRRVTSYGEPKDETRM